MDHTTPTTPEHGPSLPPFVRTINVLTALSGLLASGIGGLYAIMIGMAFFWLGIPIIFAFLTIFLLYWGCGSYGAAFTRFERFNKRRILLQICIFAIMLTGSGSFYRSTHPLQPGNPSWHAPTATMLLVFFSFTLVVHLYSLTALFRFDRQVVERQSTQ